MHDVSYSYPGALSGLSRSNLHASRCKLAIVYVPAALGIGLMMQPTTDRPGKQSQRPAANVELASPSSPLWLGFPDSMLPFGTNADLLVYLT